MVERERLLRFRFNGAEYGGYGGDTLASALLANGVHLVARSFKYHRPRGIFGSGAEEPNAIFQVGTGAHTVPNLRATQVELRDGMSAASVNCRPRPGFDLGALSGVFGGMLPAGFYYKTFMWPQRLWKQYEKVIRRAAGFGQAPRHPDPDRYEKINMHCDVLVAGAGPAGLAAALAAGRSGARVILADEQPHPGGTLLGTDERIDGTPALQWVREALRELGEMDEVTVLPRTTVYGYFDHNFLALVERVSDHLADPQPGLPRERLRRVRAARVVLATGAIEQPLVFANNDRPGIMLASAVSCYIRRYAVRPGNKGVLFTTNDGGYRAALDMLDAGMEVNGVVDPRPEANGAIANELRGRGVRVLSGSAVSSARGGRRVREVRTTKLGGSETVALECDLLAVSGGWNPAVHLHAQSGARPQFDEARGCFVPGEPVQAEQSAGAANGSFALHECLIEGYRRGLEAAQAAGCGGTAAAAAAVRVPTAEQAPFQVPPLRLWPVPSTESPGPGRMPERVQKGKRFVDYQNDTTAADLQLAVREGYASIEHAKRYTALGFGTDQGKLGNINGMAIVAAATGKSLGATGTTTFRPPWTPVGFGAIVGRDVGAFFDPVRKTAMHAWHCNNSALFENVGQWKRPWYYSRPHETMHDAVNRECLATRNNAGILDASTLGKIDISGPDSAEFLNRVYTNGWSALPLGRCRYGLMLGEDGMVMDDGVTSRLHEHRYRMTTTTGGAAHVLSWLELWLQTEWPELRVHLSSVTDTLATVSLAGPASRAIMQTLCRDIDCGAEAFPFMSWRSGVVAAIPAQVFRISFSGELCYEINVCANYGQALWDACMEAGAPHGITPYGTETMHVLRAEKGYIIVGQDTDGSVTPGDLGMEWILSRKKDYIGKRSLARPDCLRPERKQLVGLRTKKPAVVLPEGAQLVEHRAARVPMPMIGHVTSSYYSACLEHSIALALVKGGRDRTGQIVHAPLADGKIVQAEICSPVFYDPEGARQNG